MTAGAKRQQIEAARKHQRSAEQKHQNLPLRALQDGTLKLLGKERPAPTPLRLMPPDPIPDIGDQSDDKGVTLVEGSMAFKAQYVSDYVICISVRKDEIWHFPVI